MKINETVNNAVEKYVDSIVSELKDINYGLEVDVDYEPCLSTDNNQKSISAKISTEFGIIVVLPNFNKLSAIATVLKLGEINRLHSEGFSDEFIETEGKIYGEFLNYSKKNVAILSYYLSHKISPLQTYAAKS
jgi:glucosamine 6-phosphate synthetase-like amidotransferase/phosphosugar isomerase protein